MARNQGLRYPCSRYHPLDSTMIQFFCKPSHRNFDRGLSSPPHACMVMVLASGAEAPRSRLVRRMLAWDSAIERILRGLTAVGKKRAIQRVRCQMNIRKTS